MLRVDHTGSGRGARLMTTEPYAAGQLVLTIIEFTVQRHPTFQSIQVGPDVHLDNIGLLAYLNHSCQPSVNVVAEARAVVAARPIDAGEELTFFYPSTEWDMERPFACLCGAAECIREVAGAKHLPDAVLARYFINPFIRELKRQQGGA